MTDHQILVSILHNIGFAYGAIKVIKLFSTERSQQVTYRWGAVSVSQVLHAEVPQGSILAPLLYNM